MGVCCITGNLRRPSWFQGLTNTQLCFFAHEVFRVFIRLPIVAYRCARGLRQLTCDGFRSIARQFIHRVKAGKRVASVEQFSFVERL